MLRKVIQTADGSSTLYIPELDEHYHSSHGAIQESMHVYIANGLKQVKKSKIKIFEMGYGTGLNFILSYLAAEDKEIEYHCIEPYPLEQKLIQQLNYPQTLNLNAQQEKVFFNFHSSDNRIQLSNKFSLVKSICTLKDYQPTELFDLIYYDAFAPDVHPELWTLKVFQKMYDMLNSGGILTTYCSKGDVKRNLRQCGFTVKRLTGPPKKWHILRASKAIDL